MKAEHRPLSPPVERGARASDLPAYVSNGLIGLRVTEDPLAPGLCIVSGFVGEHPERLIQAAAPIPWPLGLDVALDGVWAADLAGAVQPLDQAYDFATGELVTRARLHIGDQTALLECLVFCSRTHPTIVGQRIDLTLEGAAEARLRARLQTTDVPGRCVERRLDTPGEAETVCDGSLFWRSRGELSAIGLAQATSTAFDGACEREAGDPRGPVSTTWTSPAGRRRSLRLDRLVSVVPDVLHGEPHRQAVRLVAHAAELGFDALRERNRAAWSDIWASRLHLDGAEDRWQALADAGLYYLNASVHPSSPSSTSIYGLATWRNYHYYFGHVMWDVDAFAIPPLSLLQPEAARAMLDFRSRNLDAARSNARLQGRLGLQFPWEAGPLNGQETTPGGAAAAAREVHVNLHVARAFAFDADVSGDDRFLREKVWPILSGVSDWIVDRVDHDPDGQARFRELGGPAENPGFIDEDALTTLVAKIILERTIKAADQLGFGAAKAWDRTAKALCPPMRADGAVASHADFRVDEPKGATPSPLMALFPYWADVDPGTARRTLDLYLSLWPDYVGSPMLASLYGTWAAWTGDRDLSLKLFEEGYGRYQTGRFAQTLEYRLDKIEGVASGPFFANIGGFITGLLLGLPKLKVSEADPSAWAQGPVVLPRGWREVRCDRLWIRGRPWSLRARHGADRAELTPAD